MLRTRSSLNKAKFAWSMGQFPDYKYCDLTVTTTSGSPWRSNHHMIELTSHSHEIELTNFKFGKISKTNKHSAGCLWFRCSHEGDYEFSCRLSTTRSLEPCDNGLFEIKLDDAGAKYKFVMELFTADEESIAVFSTTIRSEYCKTQLELLFSMAIAQMERSRSHILCEVLYRQQPEQYFKDVDASGGKELKEFKDWNGDPGNNINRQIKGLFFLANVYYKTTTPFWMSAFGDTQVTIPITYFFDGRGRLYFADFYCTPVTTQHWVTLVHTWNGSDADGFCKNKLKELDIRDNPFLWVDERGQFHVTTAFMIEVFHTEDIDHKYIKSIGGYTKCTSYMNRKERKGNMPKRTNCRECNIPQDDLDECFSQLSIQ